ncbi:hypothetical protein T05_12690 [Trichinella murrelli]|uniref:DUF5641 domain-containing protein n=1 Tax=Trichinella murrelli TaxID=144512 RepID=A0A0V0TBT8_9BILA|nr:hypothetical protein T05_12690 [Trichinella murrelli]
MLLSEDPRDCAPLTPAHFPIGRELAALPTSTQETSRLAGARQLRRRWQYQQMLMRQLWKRWTEEYLVSLTVRSKWKKISRQPEVDDLILVTEDTVPRNRWKLEVITELLLGSDDMVRSVRLRIAWEVLTRKSRSLCLHLRSCLSGSALKAIEGITICAENYSEVLRTLKSRFYRLPDVVESHVLSVMNCDDDHEIAPAHHVYLFVGRPACLVPVVYNKLSISQMVRINRTPDGATKALGKDVNCGLNGCHVILPTLKRKETSF